MIQAINIQEAISSLEINISDADRTFDEWIDSGMEYCDPSFIIEACFLQLLAIVEKIQLMEHHKIIFAEFSQVKNSKEGFTSVETWEGESYSPCCSRLRCYVKALRGLFPKDDQMKVTKDLLQIIKRYSLRHNRYRCFSEDPRE